jgi:integrase
MRRGEAIALKWEDLDLSTGRMVVRRSRVSVGYEVIEKAPKTEAGEGRVVYLDADTTDALRALRKRQLEERLAFGPAYQGHGLVFCREDGTGYHPDHVTKVFARLARAHGLGTTRVHSLRHLRASVLLGAGAELVDVSKTLGHASVSITSDIYGHMQERRAEQISKQAAGAVPRRRTA